MEIHASSRDFIQWLGHDLSLRILLSFENPSDIIRFSTVSTSWRDFAIRNGLSKQICLKNFPELEKIPIIIKEKSKQAGSFNSRQQKNLESDHKVYAYLSRGLAKSNSKFCISTAVSASSTDNYPQECIQNTLEPRERIGVRDSYWSSTGQTDPSVPQKLVYNLISNICIVSEIHVQPFQVPSLETRCSIYSARAVRFRMGYPKSQKKLYKYGRYKCKASHKYYDNAFSWTYISPEFRMAQENCLQKFKLPEPVLCVGGILQMELLGRVQIHETDGLYYLRITHVQVVGKPLSPGFEVEIIDSSGRCKLDYYYGVNYRFSHENSIMVTSRNSCLRRASGLEVVIQGVKDSNSKLRRGFVIQFLIVFFLFLLFLIKFPKVPFYVT
uniref:CfbP n=1 Tax=Primula vulgaris TaxID=175104 RepID=A0A1L2F3A1_9ERIC|nr:CfbP [Primula vulgaris]